MGKTKGEIMNREEIKEAIFRGDVSLGIELGSTRIKAVLISEDLKPLATGQYQWENKLRDGIWTYSLIEIWNGVSVCYTMLKRNVLAEYGIKIKKIKNIGISAMMHGYLVFDKKDNLLVPYRTWRNTNQAKAADVLSDLFNYPIPERFSVSHIYQAILNQEAHINKINYQTTLAGYIHYMLTGQKKLGIGEASGMFPIDLETGKFDQELISKFNLLCHDLGISWNYEDLLPEVLKAGECAGYLTEDGAFLLDPSGDLAPGSKLCPPEGDASTGMVATNSIAKRMGNVSAGTSAFAMIVLEKKLVQVHKEIDLVTTPCGDLVAMVHTNNCTSNLNRWIELFAEILELFDQDVSQSELYEKLFIKALNGDEAVGGLLSYEYLSGEHITKFKEGQPLLIAPATSQMNLANFMKSSLYSSLATLAIGLEILQKQEAVKIDNICAHGGFFKTKAVGQKIMSQATKSPITVMENASVGGAFGIALLASYLDYCNEPLADFLTKRVFNNIQTTTIMASYDEIRSFENYLQRYQKGLLIERAAVDNIKS